MVFSVRDVKTIAGERHALRTIESRFVERAVSSAGIACADRVDKRAVEFCDNDAIVIGISDEESIALRIRENLARKSERQLTDLRPFENEFHRLFVERAFAAKVCDELRDRLIDDVVIALARNTADDVTRGIDQHLRGPRAYAITLPDRVFRIVVNRMLDLVAQDDAPDVLGLLFVLKLSGVNADHHELARVFRFELLQIGDDVDTVDAAIGPEIE